MKDWTDNEIIALMHKDGSEALNKIADYVEKFKLDFNETAKLLREIADEKAAQAIVVKLRDELNKPHKP